MESLCQSGSAVPHRAWWRHQMEIFSALLAICAGNSPVPGEFPTQRPVTRSFDVFFDVHPNKRLSKQWWGWWFETPSCPLWRHRNGVSDVVASPDRCQCLLPCSRRTPYCHRCCPRLRHNHHCPATARRQIAGCSGNHLWDRKHHLDERLCEGLYIVYIWKAGMKLMR